MKSIAVAALFVLLLPPQRVSAHPIDEIGDIRTYDQQQILTIGAGRPTLTINLTFYALDKMKVWESIDQNKDRVAGPDERARWMVKGQEASWIQLNDQRIGFVATDLSFPDYYAFFSPEPARVSIAFSATESVPVPNRLQYWYKGKDKPLSAIDLQVTGTGGTGVSTVDRDSADSVSFTVTGGGNSSATVLGISTSRLDRFIGTYLKRPIASPGFLATALVVAAVLGGLHALTPGHGKTVVAGYLVGERGRLRDAVALSLIVTATHTSSVIALGLIALFATQYLVPATVLNAMSAVASLIVLVLGLALLVRRSGELVRIRTHDHHHSRDHDGPGSSRGDSPRLTLRSLLPLGVSGGMVPCVDALAILVVAMSLQKILLGLVILVAFSLGLATALTGAGMVAVATKNSALFQRTRLGALEQYMGVLSATVITIWGAGMLWATLPKLL